MQVIPRQVIDDQGAIRITEALRNVSGVSFGTGAGRTDTFVIRGFAANQFQNGFLDDFNASISFRESANIERIEVVKGPASVLFGRAEPSGIINLITKQPLNKPYAALDFTIGSYSFYRPTLDLSGPLTADGALAYRLNLAYEDAGSFREGLPTARRIFVAPVLRWRLGPDTTLTFEGEHLRDSPRPYDQGLVAVGDGVAAVPFTRYIGNPGSLDINQSRVYAILEHRFEPSLSMRTALRYTALRDQPTPYNPLTGAGQVLADNRTALIGQTSNDGRTFETYFMQNDLTWKFNTGSVGHTALFGLEFGRLGLRTLFDSSPGGTLDIFNPVYPVDNFGAPQRVSDSISRIGTFGVYLQDQIALFENVQLVLSGRYDTYSADDFNFLRQTQTATYAEAFSPRVGLLYQPASNVSLFANFSQSFTPVTGLSATGTPFLPQRGTGYEVGAKAELAGGRLFANLALYDIAKRNILTADPANPLFSIQVGEQQSQGIEFDIAGERLPGWNVIASYAYTDAHVSQDNVVAVGNLLPNAPLHSGSFWTTYRFRPESALSGLGFGLGVFAAGERTGDLQNSFTLPGYARTDAAVYYAQGNFRSALNFKNLFDVRYFPGADLRTRIAVGQPFTVQATIGWQF
ncbi:TonB-dependent siderophore receptor [Gloeobacter morelensis MG652769]|uniref:TonB-dependent siderophore receptor n=1 Tax=Gloeobacter morelensis MG652769 TaxID=2781736 RepID=A0ABY3PU59_9CYAN|nr:TonB-dependent siderophore receptor [Gloeobacter morelensis MG652769]